MQKLLDKEIKLTKNQEKQFLTIEKIEEFYLNKKNSKFQYGLEYERISLDKKSLCVPSYAVIRKIIEQYCEITNWELVFDDKTVIGAKDSIGNSISLEPGLQLEISLVPMESIIDIDINLSKIVSLLDKIAQAYNVIFLGVGINPSDSVETIELLDKNRYRIMNQYLPKNKKANLVQKMMRKTAGIQVNIDYKDKKDAYLKLLFFNLISPFILGLSANSVVENNKSSSYKSLRGNIWRYSGANRCNFFYKDVFSKIFFKYSNVFKNYINSIIDVPMVYIERNSKIIPIEGKITFKEFLKNGFSLYNARFEDYILHQSLCFPDVRLKNYIEIRNHDSSDIQTALSFCAFYKGLSLNNIEDLIQKFSYLKIENIDFYNNEATLKGLDFNLNSKKPAWSVIEELFELSINKLNSKERIYLNPIFNLIKQRKTKADIILDYGINNSKDLFSYLYE